MGADAGLKMTLLEDAVIGFELEQRKVSAETIHLVTLALLEADFARIIASDGLNIV